MAHAFDRAPTGPQTSAPAAPARTPLDRGPVRLSGGAGLESVTVLGLEALQRSAGNAAVIGMLQRAPAPPVDAPPPPTAAPTPGGPTQTAPAPGEALIFEGITLRPDETSLRDTIRGIAEKRGIHGAAEFTGRFRNANPLTLLKGNERPGLVQDVLKALDAANASLDAEREDFLLKFQYTADQAALGILDKSRDTITAELARLGIGTTTKDDEGSPVTSYHLSNTQGAKDLKAAAAALVPAATEMDKHQAEMEAVRAQVQELEKAAPPTDLAAGSLPGARFPGQNPLPPALLGRFGDVNQAFMQAAEAYETQRREKVAAAPSLALYAQQPGATAKLTAMSTMGDDTLANDIGAQGKQRLANIETVRPEVGKRFSAWHQPHLRRVTLDQMQATNFQRDAVEMRTRDIARVEADDSMYFGLLAIGLGILTAIPTGGSSLIAGISAAAAGVGAGLSMYQLTQTMAAYELASAANATDFDKAKAISDQDPDGFQLAMDLVAAIADVLGAAAAYKAIRPLAKATQAGNVEAAIKLATTADSVGLKGAAKNRVIGTAVASLSEADIVKTGKTVAVSGGMEAAIGAARVMHGGAHNMEFARQLEQAIGLMEHVQGRIPDAARHMVDTGRVRPLTEEALAQVFGRDAAQAMMATYTTSAGLHFPEQRMIFLRAGRTPEEIAGTLIHEATHRVSVHNPVRLTDFMNEAVAHFVERDFYASLYAEGGPLFGRTPTSPHIRELLSLGDEGIMKMIEDRYYKSMSHLPEPNRRMYLNPGLTPADVERAIADDIAHAYEAEFPPIQRGSDGAISVAGERLPPRTQPMPGAPPHPAPTTQPMAGAPERPKVRVPPEEPPKVRVPPEEAPKVRVADDVPSVTPEEELLPPDEEQAPKAMRRPPVRP